MTIETPGHYAQLSAEIARAKQELRSVTSQIAASPLMAGRRRRLALESRAAALRQRVNALSLELGLDEPHPDPPDEGWGGWILLTASLAGIVGVVAILARL